MTENVAAKLRGLPLPHKMERADFLTQRYCHPKGEVDGKIARLLADLGEIGLYNAPSAQERTTPGTDNDGATEVLDKVVVDGIERITKLEAGVKDHAGLREQFLIMVKEHTELKTMLQQSQTTVQELNTTVTMLEAVVKENAELREQFLTIVKEHTELKEQFLTTANEHMELKEQFLATAKEHTEPKEQFLTTAKEHAGLKNQLLTTEKQHTELKEQYLAMAKEHAELKTMLQQPQTTAQELSCHEARCGGQERIHRVYRG